MGSDFKREQDCTIEVQWQKKIIKFSDYFIKNLNFFEMFLIFEKIFGFF